MRMKELRERVRQLADAPYLPEAVKEILQRLHEKIQYANDMRSIMECIVYSSEYLVKYFVLLEIACVFDQKKIGKNQKNEIQAFFRKGNRTFGDWYAIIKNNKLGLKGRVCAADQLIDFFDQTKMVSKRNRINHMLVIAECWTKEDIEILKNIIEVFCEALEKINACEMRLNLNETERVYVQIKSKDVCLSPWVIEKNQKVYLFEGTWDSPKYSDGYPIMSGIFCEKREEAVLTEQLEQEIILAGCRTDSGYDDNSQVVMGTAAYSKIYTDAEIEQKLRTQHKNQIYFENKTITKWYRNSLRKKKGLFLLRMARGLGKTAFVASQDPKLKEPSKKREEENLDQEALVCCYYCNKQQYSGVEDFIDFCNNEIKDVRINMIRNPQIDIAQKNGEKNLGELLNKIKIERQKRNRNGKIIVFIDGVDEIVSSKTTNNKEGKTIWDFLPTEEELQDGIYIFLTCRTDLEEQGRGSVPTTFIEEKLNQIPAENTIVVNITDQGHINAVHSFVRHYFKAQVQEAVDTKIEEIRIEHHWENDPWIKQFLQGKSNPKDLPEGNTEELLSAKEIIKKIEGEEIVRLSEEMEYSFVNLKLCAKLQEITKRDFGKRYTYEQKIKIYLACLGEKNESIAKKIAANIVYAKRALYIGELLDLSDEAYEGNITLGYLDILNDLEPFIFYGRTKQGTVISLNNLKYETALKELLRSDMEEMFFVWVTRILKEHEKGLASGDRQFYKNEFYKEKPLQIPHYAQTYLHAYIYDYAVELDQLPKLATPSFVKCLGNFESYRQSDNFGIGGVLQDIRTLGAAIAIREQYFAPVQELSYDECKEIFVLYNDRAYLYSKIKEDDEVRTNSEVAAELLSLLEEKISGREQEIDYLKIKGKFYNNCGSFDYQSANGNIDDALEYFKKGFQIRSELIEQYGDLTFQEESEACLLSCKNVLSAYARKDFLTEKEKEEAQEYYQQGKNLLNRIVEKASQGIGSVNNQFDLNTHRDHRSDYGYRFLDSELDRFYALFLRHVDYDDASKYMENSIEKMKQLLRKRPQEISIIRGIIQRYLEAVRLYQEKEKTYLLNAMSELKSWEERAEQDKLLKDSRFAEIYYRYLQIEKLNLKPQDDLDEVLNNAFLHIQYLESSEERQKAPENAIFMYHLIKQEMENN